MTTFALTIELGNEAMQTDEDVARALHRTASWFEENSSMFEQCRGGIYDVNGNRVGSWNLS